MAPGILNTMVPHMCLYRRYWWNKVNISPPGLHLTDFRLQTLASFKYFCQAWAEIAPPLSISDFPDHWPTWNIHMYLLHTNIPLQAEESGERNLQCYEIIVIYFLDPSLFFPGLMDWLHKHRCLAWALSWFSWSVRINPLSNLWLELLKPLSVHTNSCMSAASPSNILNTSKMLYGLPADKFAWTLKGFGSLT